MTTVQVKHIWQQTAALGFLTMLFTDGDVLVRKDV